MLFSEANSSRSRTAPMARAALIACVAGCGFAILLADFRTSLSFCAPAELYFSLVENRRLPDSRTVQRTVRPRCSKKLAAIQMVGGSHLSPAPSHHAGR